MNEQHYTNSQRASKEAQIQRLKAQIESLQSDIHYTERNCNHQYEVTPDHIYEPAYTIPGDEPGTMGVDWRGPCYVEAKTTKRWKRTCKVCGKTEHTSQVNVRTEESPRFD